MSGEIILKAEHVYKSFGPTKALVDFSLIISQGEVHGLIGENGSGKSTFSSIISGIQGADEGQLFLKDKEYLPKDMPSAQKQGVCMITQEASTFEDVKVGFNVFAGNLDKFTRYGVLNESRLINTANQVLADIGAADIAADTQTAYLNFEDRKIVEIARSMYFNPDILIIDETTTALAQKGREIIYNLIERQKRNKKAVLFISHDLEELKSVCNIVTVMRDGHYIATLTEGDITIDNMRSLMVGRELQGSYFRDDWDSSHTGKVAIELKQATLDDRIKNLDIKLHKGEILGLGGLANSGMHEVGRMFAGIEKLITGQVLLAEKSTEIKNSAQAVKHRIGYVSKNRDIEALIQNATIIDNLEMASYDLLSHYGIITKKAEKQLYDKMKDNLKIKCATGAQMVRELSGGNKQKVVFAKWIARDCDILILDCPTRGIDVGVKAEMYKLIYNLKQQGKAILLISEELPELVGMSDRILIFKDGQIAHEFLRSQSLTEHDIISYMI